MKSYRKVISIKEINHKVDFFQHFWDEKVTKTMLIIDLYNFQFSLWLHTLSTFAARQLSTIISIFIILCSCLRTFSNQEHINQLFFFYLQCKYNYLYIYKYFMKSIRVSIEQRWLSLKLLINLIKKHFQCLSFLDEVWEDLCPESEIYALK